MHSSLNKQDGHNASRPLHYRPRRGRSLLEQAEESPTPGLVGLPRYITLRGLFDPPRHDLSVQGSEPDGHDAYSTRLTGRLLVASLKLDDPNFERAVILVLDHGDDGALGIVLNRPTALRVEEILESWYDQALMAPPGVVFSGGPVSPDAVIGLARSRQEDGDLTMAGPEHWRPVLDGLGTVDLSVPPENQPIPLAGARLFSGYAGWTPGQLEQEIGEAAWYVVDAMADDPLRADPDRLWHDVLRRQGGDLALIAAFPQRLSVN